MQKLVLFLVAISLINCNPNFNGAKYQSQSRADKMTQIWSEIASNTTPNDWYGVIDQAGLFTESMKVSFDTVSDSMPSDRKKIIHTVGVIGKAHFVSLKNHSYTGIFQGFDSALLRLSVANKPDYSKKTAEEAYQNFIPGYSLKVLRNNVPSANVFGLNSLDGQKSWNFFKSDLSNHLDFPNSLKLKLLAKKFSTATKYVGQIGLKPLGDFDQDGVKAEKSVYPYRIFFRPTDAVKNLFSDDFTESYMDQLKTIKSGTHIYDLYAIEKPEEACEKLIGGIYLDSDLVSSKFGDEGLFFQHNYFNADLDQYSNWNDYSNHWGYFSGVEAKKAEGKCPYLSHLNRIKNN